MDSVTQFVLGAGVGAAVLGSRLGPRRAAIVGGLLGTAPDLDVFFPYETAVDSFTLHRGPTHSLVVQALVTPLFGEALMRLFRWLDRERGDTAQPVSRLRWYAAVYLIFATHAILDAATVYGTKLFWPIYPDPVGAGTVFIIDPLYTLPLLILCIWSLIKRGWTVRFGRGVFAALLLSSLYLGWSATAQKLAEARALEMLGPGRGVENAIAIPTPFNTLFWRVIVLDGDRYLNVYVPLLGGADDVTAYAHPRRIDSAFCQNVPDFIQAMMFSKFFVRLDVEGDRVVLSDLRMGLTPDYVFRFSAVPGSGSAERALVERNMEADLDWLWAGIRGLSTVRPVEAGNRIDLTEPWPVFTNDIACAQ